ncbi:hypothetical protein ACNKHU_24735 [Shigella flexneri]
MRGRRAAFLPIRSAERFAQLYTQVAGRAGRAGKQGEVVLQAHHPDILLVANVARERLRAFAETGAGLSQLHDAAAAVGTSHGDCACGDHNNQHAPLFLQTA